MWTFFWAVQTEFKLLKFIFEWQVKLLLWLVIVVSVFLSIFWTSMATGEHESQARYFTFLLDVILHTLEKMLLK